RTIMEQNLIEKLWDIGNRLQVDMWLISNEKVHYSNNPPVDFSKEEWLKIGYAHLNQMNKESVLQELAYFQKDLEISNSYIDNLEVNKKGINKANAIEKVCKREGILMDEVLVAGDGLNDEKMI